MKQELFRKKPERNPMPASWTRRKFLKVLSYFGIASMPGVYFLRSGRKKEPKVKVFIASINDYNTDIRHHILRGFQELGITSSDVKGKRILLKPNIVEPNSGHSHISTHPFVIRATIEAFLFLGANKVVVAEGSGHQQDFFLLLEESGVIDVLYEDRIPFVDLNTSPFLMVKNLGKFSNIETLFLPQEIIKADLVVSLAKMKTHHWAGATLSMKNMFGVMPGIIYGWPKNFLHCTGIHESILDINATVKPHLAIIDGIVGMEGDGPIMGTSVQANVLVMGKNLPAVDATSARIMGINPNKIPYLRCASGRLGAIREPNIIQLGETIFSVRKTFQLIDYIPAHRGLRLRL